jgi:tetratricopeptide (TPR) repeat protein
MSAVRENLARGLECRQAGRLEDSARYYRAAFELDPGDPDANHLLGAATGNAGLVARAIVLRADVPAFHSSLGEIFQRRGALREACLCYEEALRLEPGFVPALVNLSGAMHGLGRYQEAAAAGWKAIQARPDCAEAFDNLGNALAAQEKYHDAAECHRQALRINPRLPRAWVNLSAIHLRQARFADAAECARRALEIDPGFAEALTNLSVALTHLKQLAEAETACRAALESQPRSAFLHSNLGSILLRRNQPRQAEASCRRALELDPHHAESAHNLGAALVAQDRWAEAIAQFEAILREQPDRAAAWIDLGGALYLTRLEIGRARACFEAALRHAPESAGAHLQRAIVLLVEGRFAEGLEEYEWRYGTFDRQPRTLAFPAWDGRPLAGRRLLLFAEQGLGDTIQFARYATLAAARGGRVIVECQPRLMNLVASVPGVAEVVANDTPLPAFDVQAGLMSLPRLLGTTPDTIPGRTPYMNATPERIEEWRRRLGAPAGRRVGLFWAGNPDHPADRHRSMRLCALESLRLVPGVEWHSLHTGAARREEARESGGWVRATLPEDSDIDDLAALMACLDLVITVDSMPGHLAGALARPVWTLLPLAPDWRWQLDRGDSAWYPTMRLFRQRRFGDWSEPVKRVEEELRR